MNWEMGFWLQLVFWLILGVVLVTLNEVTP